MMGVLQAVGALREARDGDAFVLLERVSRLHSEVVTTGDFYSDRQWHSTGMYNECMAPGGG
jgi:hypothetical protein